MEASPQVGGGEGSLHAGDLFYRLRRKDEHFCFFLFPVVREMQGMRTGMTRQNHPTGGFL